MAVVSRKASAAALAFSLLWVTGCVGPMACGPGGSCGPIAMTSCDGCGECEGCGELYVDPWINHPADVHDPCDQCGNHNGQSCGKCRSVFSGIASLWGYRCDGGCATSSCGGCDDISCGGCDGGVIEPTCGVSCDGCDSCCESGDAVYLSGEPTPAMEVLGAVPAETTYKPHRTRKIFQSRKTVAQGLPQASDY